MAFSRLCECCGDVVHPDPPEYPCQSEYLNNGQQQIFKVPCYFDIAWTSVCGETIVKLAPFIQNSPYGGAYITAWSASVEVCLVEYYDRSDVVPAGAKYDHMCTSDCVTSSFSSVPEYGKGSKTKYLAFPTSFCGNTLDIPGTSPTRMLAKYNDVQKRTSDLVEFNLTFFTPSSWQLQLNIGNNVHFYRQPNFPATWSPYGLIDTPQIFTLDTVSIDLCLAQYYCLNCENENFLGTLVPDAPSTITITPRCSDAGMSMSTSSTFKMCGKSAAEWDALNLDAPNVPCDVIRELYPAADNIESSQGCADTWGQNGIFWIWVCDYTFDSTGNPVTSNCRWERLREPYRANTSQSPGFVDTDLSELAGIDQCPEGAVEQEPICDGQWGYTSYGGFTFITQTVVYMPCLDCISAESDALLGGGEGGGGGGGGTIGAQAAPVVEPVQLSRYRTKNIKYQRVSVVTELDTATKRPVRKKLVFTKSEETHDDDFWISELKCPYRQGIIDETTCDVCGSRGKKADVYGCEKFGKCTIKKRKHDLKACVTCPHAKLT